MPESKRVQRCVKKARSRIFILKHESKEGLLRCYIREWREVNRELRTSVSSAGRPVKRGRARKIRCSFVTAWLRDIVLAEGARILHAMVGVLSDEVFQRERKPDPALLKGIDSFIKALHGANSIQHREALETFEGIFTEFLIEKNLVKKTRRLASRASCTKTIRRLNEWTKNIECLVSKYELSPFVQMSMNAHIGWKCSKYVFKKALEDLDVLFQNYMAPLLDEIMNSLEFSHATPSFLLYGFRLNLRPRKLDPLLWEWRDNYLRLESMAGQFWHRLNVVWGKLLSEKIVSRISPYPTEPTERITDTDAYLMHYYLQWTSFCHHLYFYGHLTRLMKPCEDEFAFVDRCISGWQKRILTPECSNIFHHLGVKFQQHLIDQEKLDDIFLTVTNSLDAASVEVDQMFITYLVEEVIYTHASATILRLRDELTPENCSQKIPEALVRPKDPPGEHPYYEVIDGFNTGILEHGFAFMSTKIEQLITNEDVHTINRMCAFVNASNASEGTLFYAKILDTCTNIGLEALSAFEGRRMPLTQSAMLLMISARRFDKLVTGINNPIIKKFMTHAFGVAVSATLGSKACSVILGWFDRATTSDHKLDLTPEELEQQSRAIARAVRYLTNVDDFCRIYVVRLLNRILFERSRSLLLESIILREMAEFFSRPLRLSVGYQMMDIVVSSERMGTMPSLFGFKQALTTTGQEGGEFQTDEAKAREAIEGKRWDEKQWSQQTFDEALGYPVGQVSYQGVETNIRVLRAHLWPIPIWKISFTPLPIFEAIACNFEKFYRIERPTQTLRWIHYFPSVTMLWRFTPDQREYTVRCDTFVATVLSMFEDVDEIPYKTIQQRMNLSLDVLKVIVRRLLEEKVLLERGDEETRGIPDEDKVLRLNSGFSAPTLDFLLQCRYPMDEEGTSGKPNSTSEGEKSFGMACVQARMVRIAKSETKLPRTDLEQRTMEVLSSRTGVDSGVLKKAFMDLVRQNYLTHDQATDIVTYVP